jgi:soluble lytic murein transglycosylase-like protein
MRGSWLLWVVLVTGCAAEVATSELGSTSTEPIYDPIGALAERESPNDGRRAEPVRRPRYTPSEPPPMLRPFSDGELHRIDRVQSIVHAAARDHGLPPDIVNGIIWVESRFVPTALGKKGPRGLMQIMPRTGRELARELGRSYAPYDPDFNIHAGSLYFARMVRRFDGNLRLALAAYNIGPAVVDRWMRDAEPLPGHSNAYVDDVFTAARTFRDRLR